MNKRKIIRKWASTFYADYSGRHRWSHRHYFKKPEIVYSKRGDGSLAASIEGVCIKCYSRIKAGETFWGVPPTCHECHRKRHRRGSGPITKKYRYESDRR